MTMNINDFCPLDEYITSIHDDGKEWFCAESIRRALQNDEERTGVVQDLEGIVPCYSDQDDARFVSEDDFYRWVFGSRNPTAERFLSWVTTVVMPTVIEDRLYMFGKEKSLPTPASEDEGLWRWKDQSIINDEEQLMSVIGWWDYVVEMLKELRRDGGIILYLNDIMDEADPTQVDRQAVKALIAKKIKRRDQIRRAVA
jgi:prophage antirepressor-like protein